MTILCTLVAKRTNENDYTTYVFKLQNSLEIELHNRLYLTCTRFPNWDEPYVEIGDEGYLSYREVKGGVDNWFNGTELVPYNYSFVQFFKFIKRPTVEDLAYKA